MSGIIHDEGSRSLLLLDDSRCLGIGIARRGGFAGIGIPHHFLDEIGGIGGEHILNCMMETISEPRAEMKPQVPRIVAFDIPKEFIGAVIGPGGKIIPQNQKQILKNIYLSFFYGLALSD